MEMTPISLAIFGTDSAIPATADVTDTAGVNMPSATVSAVPNRAYRRCKHIESGSEKRACTQTKMIHFKPPRKGRTGVALPPDDFLEAKSVVRSLFPS